MSTIRDEKEDKAMSTISKTHRAHDVLNGLYAGRILSKENEQLLRSFLPELPKQMKLEEITEHVRYAWIGTSDNVWAGNSYNTEITLESWLGELYVQLQGLSDAEPAKPAPPEFLETEADYTDVPEGTILTIDGLDTAWVKKFDGWVSTETSRERSSKELGYVPRRVLRWGWGK